MDHDLRFQNSFIVWQLHFFLLAVGGIGREYGENKKKTAKREPIEKNKTKQKANAKNQNHRLIHEH